MEVILAGEKEEVVDGSEEMEDIALDESVVSLMTAARSAHDARSMTKDVACVSQNERYPS